MKTYVVTGGSGFIGSTLAEELLAEGNKVINIDNFNDYYDTTIKISNTIESCGLSVDSCKLLEESWMQCYPCVRG